MYNYKIVVSLFVLLLLVSSVTGYMCIHEEDNPYSFDNSNEVHEWREPQLQPVKIIITKDEYNQIFKDYRDGIISKEDASRILRSSKW